MLQIGIFESVRIMIDSFFPHILLCWHLVCFTEVFVIWAEALPFAAASVIISSAWNENDTHFSAVINCSICPVRNPSGEVCSKKKKKNCK